MEQFKLPFPSLEFLASLAVVRRMVLMKADEAYWEIHHSLRECELRVDKLPLPPAPREYVKNVLRGFFVPVKRWVFYNCRNPGADILVDAHGNLDERGTIRHDFEKCYKDKFYREDFRPLCRFLEHFCWHHPDCNRDFVSIIVNLQEIYTFLEGPGYRIVDGQLQVVFRFVNRHRVPSAFNALLEWNEDPLEISMEQKDVLVTFRVYNQYYDEDMFKIHVDLLQPSQRLEFVKEVLYWRMKVCWVQQVLRFLNVLDPELRRDSILHQNEDGFYKTARCFLNCCLIPGYESLFIPMLKSVRLNLDRKHYLYLFYKVVQKMDIDLIGYSSLLLQFWKLVPASPKSEFHSVLKDRNNQWHWSIKYAMKKLSGANSELFRVVSDDMFTSPKKKACLAP